MYANNSTTQSTNHAGFNDVLADHSLIDSALIDGAVKSLRVLPGGAAVPDRYPLMSRERIDAVLGTLRSTADIIVVVAPSISENIDSYPICGAADLTILVVGQRSSRAGDVVDAVQALSDAHAVLLGAVLAETRHHRHAEAPAPAPQQSAEATEEAITHSGQP